MCERDVLCSLTHPYLVTLRFAFQTNHRLFLVMDYIEGGHLWTHMKSGFLPEAVARVFAAEIVLALIHLHGLGIAHRDLKPENILLDSDNHCRLTDFGLAKRDMDEDSRAHTMVGTIDYMAPEARPPPSLPRTSCDLAHECPRHACCAQCVAAPLTHALHRGDDAGIEWCGRLASAPPWSVAHFSGAGLHSHDPRRQVRHAGPPLCAATALSRPRHPGQTEASGFRDSAARMPC